MIPMQVKRIFTAAMTLAALTGTLCSSVLAAATQVTEKTGQGSIVVTVRDTDPGTVGTGAAVTSDGAPVANVEIRGLRIGSVVELTTTETTGSTVTVGTQVAFGLSSEIAAVLGLHADEAIATEGGVSYFEPQEVQLAVENQELQDALEGYLRETGNPAVTVVTGDDGVARMDGLDYGLYLLGKGNLPAETTTDLVPFLVSLPAFVEADNAWNGTVYAYPKVRTATITPVKTTASDTWVDAGETIPFAVAMEIPATGAGMSQPQSFTSFVLTDTNPQGTLSIDTAEGFAVSLNGEELLQDIDYTFSYPEDGTTHILTVALTQMGLDKLNLQLGQQQTIVASYQAEVATDATFETQLRNSAQLTYNRGNGDVISEESTVTLYTYGLNLTKTLSDGGNIAADTIRFALYADADCQREIPLVEGAGGYWCSDSGASSGYVDTNGQLNIYGLAPGTYYLKELATMEHYTLLDAPLIIVIGAQAQASPEVMPTVTATVNGASASVNGGVVALAVENTRNTNGFTLPATGENGMLGVTAMGLGFLSLAVILLAVYRRKSKT